MPEHVKLAVESLHTIYMIRLGDKSAVYETFRLGRLGGSGSMRCSTSQTYERANGNRSEPETLERLRQLLKPDQRAPTAQDIAGLMDKGMSVEAACKSLMPKYGVSLSTLKRCRSTV